MHYVVDNLWITCPGYSMLVLVCATRCRGATICRSLRPGSLRSRAWSKTPLPPFFNKHALLFVKQGLRVTILCKNVIIEVSKKFLKNGKCF